MPLPALPGYRVLDVVGRGGFGVVYRAVQEAVDREVAVKVDSRVVIDEHDRRRFLREARAAGRLSGHPHVVDLYDAGILADGRPYLVMELCTGGSMLKWIHQQGPLPLAAACQLGANVADALVAAHEAGVLHRDIKPSNILINRYGVYGLADFGLAALTEPGRDSSASLAALTPAYAAPEMFRQEAPSERADIYSLAATVHAVLTGRPPRFPATGEPNLTEIIRLHDQPLPEIPSVPASVNEVLAKALASDPRQRFESAAEFRAALVSLDLPADPPVVPVQPDEPRIRSLEELSTRSFGFGPRRDEVLTLGRVPAPVPLPNVDEAAAEGAGEDADEDRARPSATPGSGKRLILLSKASRVVIALISVAVLVVAGVIWAIVTSLQGAIQQADVLSGPDGPDPADGATDILLIGNDSRTDADGNPLPLDILKQLRTEQSDGTYTDSIILVRVPDNGAKPRAVSIPSNSRVPIPHNGDGPINSAFDVGKRAAEVDLRDSGVTDHRQLARDSDRAGRKMLVDTVQQLTGVRIDHYAELNLYGFYLLSNAIGGVQVCLKADVSDPDSGSNFKAGQQLISGGDALSFIRQRKGLPHGEQDRIVRQQTFMAAAVDKLLSAGVLTDPTAIAQLVDTLRRTAVIDSGWDVLAFAQQLRDVAAGNVEFVTIPVLNQEQHPGTGTGVSTVDAAQVRTFVTGLLTHNPAPSMPAASRTHSSGAPAIAVNGIPTPPGDPTCVN